uniref:Uncharacterized protein n=1 Tax=Spongospora subterranea TaxID=70186 RepID=A0A0H5RER0_9EUKA|eukprot:CRZ07089.1 hypothetical protein [Spongospora subterranea]
MKPVVKISEYLPLVPAGVKNCFITGAAILSKVIVVKTRAPSCLEKVNVFAATSDQTLKDRYARELEIGKHLKTKTVERQAGRDQLQNKIRDYHQLLQGVGCLFDLHTLRKIDYVWSDLNCVGPI